MKKGLSVLLIIVVIVGIIAVAIMGKYNSIVTLSEKVDNQYANVDTQLERRADLIPNLVNTVKGYMTHEEKIISNITTARENLLKANTIEEQGKANDELTNAINALMVVVENYPDLKASQNFINLQDELAGTENRISVARKDYNDAVKEYNTEIKKFPSNVIAGMFNFDKKAYFEVSDNKKEVPEVEF